MEYRTLTEEEYMSQVPGMVPGMTAIGAVDENGDVVACIGVIKTLHLDPLWVREAYKVLHLQGQPLPGFRGLYLATLGAAKALYLDDKIGNFIGGKEADFRIFWIPV